MGTLPAASCAIELTRTSGCATSQSSLASERLKCHRRARIAALIAANISGCVPMVP